MKTRISFVFDLETTGLPPKTRYGDIIDPKNFEQYDKCRIVQISWILQVRFGNKDEQTKKTFIVKPDNFVIPQESIDIHGISQDIAEAKGIPLDNILRILETDLKIWKPARIVCHNLEFDTNVLASELYRYKGNDTLRDFLIDIILNCPGVCTMKLGRDICKIPFPKALSKNNNWKNPTLSELYYKLTGLTLEGAHNAEADTQACSECYNIMLDNFKKNVCIK